MQTLTYHNDETLKQDLITEMERHKENDQMIKGKYSKTKGKFLGCAVGCAVNSLKVKRGLEMDYDDHASLSKALGWGEWLERLHDLFFENLPEPNNQEFAVELLRAVPVGVDIEPVEWRFCAYLMQENIDSVLKLDISDELKEKVVGAIRQVLELNLKAVETGAFNESAAESAAWSAESAARSVESAAWSAARSVESAAWSAARSAESAAWSAARSAEFVARSAVESAARSVESAARSVARSVARSAAYKRHSIKLLELLRQAGK